MKNESARALATVLIALALAGGFGLRFSENAEAAFINDFTVPWGSSFIPNDSVWDPNGSHAMAVGQDAAGQSNAWAYNHFSETWTKVLPGEFVGDGSAQYPYMIKDVWELQAMKDDLTANYSLANDIDASDTINWNGGAGFLPVGTSMNRFSGSLDGRNHTVTGLHISRSVDYVGLFSYVGATGHVFNITLKEAYVSGNLAVGGLVGSNAGLVRGAHVTGAIVASGANSGGVVGYNNQGKVERCSSTATVTSTANNAGGVVGYNYGYLNGSWASGNVDGLDNVGGLAGYHYNSDINDCYAHGSANGNIRIGGLVGNMASANVARSYSKGLVTGASTLGGLIGFGGGTTTTASFWDMDTSGMATSNGGNGQSTVQMMTQSTFTSVGWDFIGLWHMTEGLTYPMFRWQDLPVEGGTGTAVDPYLIRDAWELQDMKNNLTAHYALANDIDASDTVKWNGGAGFEPVGNYSNRFTGSFDGRNCTITGLYMNRPSTDYIGLFGCTDIGVLVRNLGIIDCNVVGNYYVGTLVGRSLEATVSNCHSTGTTTGYRDVGGLVGRNAGSVGNSSSTGSVSGTDDNVGGLVGYNDYGTITDSYAAGITDGLDMYVGGLVGYNNWATISRCYAIGSVSGNWYGGGLVGHNYRGTVSNSYATGDVSRKSGSLNLYFGGFMGYNYWGKAINCYSTGRVRYEDATDPEDKGFVGVVEIGGEYEMTGNFWDTETSLQSTTAGSATGQTTGQMMAQSTYGGWDFTNVWWMLDGQTRPFLRMEWSTEIRNSHQLQMMSMNLGASYKLGCDIDLDITDPAQMWGTSTGSGAGFVSVGTDAIKFSGTFEGNGHSITNLYIQRPTVSYIGLIGYTSSPSKIYNVTLENVNVTGYMAVGGLVGYNYGLIQGCHVSGKVLGNWYNVGGISGYNSGFGIISRCGNSADITSNVNNAGGISGYCQGSISESFSTGAIQASTYAGGLGGYLDAVSLTNCYATGDVTATSATAGGLGAYATSGTSITNSYSTGFVTSPSTKGGLIGSNSGGTVTASFWDVETSGIATSSGGTGLTTSGMKTRSTYESAGWDLTTVWWAEDGYYPLLAEPGASGGGGGAQFPPLHSVAWDSAAGQFWTCGDTGGPASVYYVWPHQIDTLVPVRYTPAYSFTAIAADHLGNVLVGGSNLDGLHYYNTSADVWHTIPDSAGSMAAWNITGITFNHNDNRFYIVGNETAAEAVAFFTDTVPLGAGSKCHRDQSGFPETRNGLRAIEWNRNRDYALATGDGGVYRVNAYDGNPQNNLTWSFVGGDPGNVYHDISWDSDGWNEAAIVGSNQGFGNYWRYYDTNPQLIQGHKDSVSGTEYRTCAFKPPSSAKWVLIPHAGGGIRINAEEKYEGGEITVHSNYPHIFEVDMWKQSDSGRNSVLNKQVEANSTYTFFIEGNYTRDGLDYWADLDVELLAWYDGGLLGGENSAYPAEMASRRNSQFNLTCNAGSGAAAMNFPLPAAPAVPEFSVQAWRDPGSYGPDGSHRRLYINVTFGPQMLMAPAEGVMADAVNPHDNVSALNDRFSWDFRVMLYDRTFQSARNVSYDEFGVQRYARISASGSPVGSIPPGASSMLSEPTVLVYSANTQYKLNVSIPNLLKDGNPLQYIPAEHVQVRNTHFNASAYNSNISAWVNFTGPGQNQMIWGTESIWMQPVGNGTVSAGQNYSDYTAAPDAFQATPVWWVVGVIAATQEGTYRAIITITLWS